jgi:3-hydroxybutyryl-CoA dehydratase
VTDWRVGDVVGRLQRTMTAERMRWHVEGLDVAAGEAPARAAVNFHTDDESARANGLPGRIADGMVTTNWLSSLLVQAFGDAVLWDATMQAKFIKPVFEGDRIEAWVTVTAVDDDGAGGRTIRTELRCENQDGELCTIGTAAVTVAPDGGPRYRAGP